MKYAIKQKLVSIGDDFDIKDSTGKKIYFVDGKGFTFGADLEIKDMARTSVARIKQKLFTIVPTYRILIGGKEIAVVKKKLFTIRQTFTILPRGGRMLTATGNLFLYDYQIKRDRQKIAKVSKKIIAFSDSYGVDINDDENQILILASSIIIDIVLHKGK